MTGHPRRRGPRGGTTDTRAQILEAARELFAAEGYDATSIRAVARSADVDPALVHHYFGSKSELFTRAVIDSTANPAEVAGRISAAPPDRRGHAMVALFLSLWDAPANRRAFTALVRAATAHQQLAVATREFLTAELLGRVLVDVDASQRATTGALIASQMAGLGITRYVLQVPGITEAPVEVLIERVGTTIQNYIDAGRTKPVRAPTVAPAHDGPADTGGPDDDGPPR